MAINWRDQRQIILYEDQAEAFLPLTYMRSVFDLRCGAFSFRERMERILNRTVTLWPRPELVSLYEEKGADLVAGLSFSGRRLFGNGRAFFSPQLMFELNENCSKIGYSKQTGDWVLAWLSAAEAEAWQESSFSTEMFPQIEKEELDVPVVSAYWDLLRHNVHQLEQDYGHFFAHHQWKGDQPGIMHRGKPIAVGQQVDLAPGVVLDASEGPIILDDHVKIFPGSILIGPLFIGKSCQIKAGAKIYEGCSFGPVCKVGGEIEETIIQGYSNKQHDGFLGHALLGEWINLGAGTNNSDLKNNYSPVSAWQNGVIRNTGLQFLGSIIGDYSRFGIATTLNTGTVIGLGCNLFDAGFFPKFVDSFSWGTPQQQQPYQLDKLLETIATVKSRRKQSLGRAEKERLEYLYQCRFATDLV